MTLPRCGKCAGCRKHFGGQEPGAECKLWADVETRAPEPWPSSYSWPSVPERLAGLERALSDPRAQARARH